MCALSLAAQAQKTPDAPTAGPGPVVNCTPTLTANRATLCQGGAAVLTVTLPCATSPYTFAWSPNQNISSTTTGQVVVNPLATTTYTVTASTPGTAPLLLSLTVNVQANCCQYPGPSANVVELTQATYPYNPTLADGGDPFRNDYSTTPATPYPPGTYFHAAGSLTLQDNTYRMPPGGVLLMEAGADIVLDDARLELNGSTITAACNDMWGRVDHTSDAHGVYANAVGTLPPRIMHSLEGLKYAHDPFTAPSNYFLRLDGLEFLHNYQSLLLDHSGAAANGTEYVTHCFFDSDPALMKAPYNPSGTDYFYTQTHVRVLGNTSALRFAHNKLGRALVGIGLLQPGPVLTVDDCVFTDFQLAGIASDASAKYGAQLTVQNSNFAFPTAAKHPLTTQVPLTLSAYGPALYTDATPGISALDIPLTATTTVFRQYDTSPYANFGYANYRTQQIGIISRNLVTAQNNAFRALGVGIALEVPANTAADVERNLFTECAKGLSLLKGSGQAYVTCNTFERGVSFSTRSGLSYGIINEAASTVRLEDPSLQPGATPAILKNLFDDAGAQMAGYYALFNNNGIQSISYNTYDNYRIGTVASLSNSGVFLPVHNPKIDYPKNNTDCVLLNTPNGLPRGAASGTTLPAKDNQTRLEQNVPNPARGTTRIAYNLVAGTQQATLLVYRAVDGQPVAKQTLPLNATQYELPLQGYAPGVYFYRLLVDGVATAPRRLAIEN